MTTSTVNTQILLKHGNTSASSTYIGPVGEITLDTDLQTVRVHNGITAGGSVLPSAAMSANIANVNAFTSNVSVLQTQMADLSNVARTGLYSDLVGTPPVATILNTGNVLYSGNTIQGLTLNQDITITTSGTGYVAVPRIKLPTGGLVEEFNTIETIIADVILDAVADYSTGSGDNLNIGNYGLSNGIAHPWTVYRLTGSASALQLNDIIAGAGIPVNSNVLFVGTGAYANYFITDTTYISTPPGISTVIHVARPIVNASLTISTNDNTDISLVTGIGGRLISDGTLLPFLTNTYDLGTPSRRWKDMWLGGSSIYMVDTVLGSDMQLSAANGNFVVTGGGISGLAGMQVGEWIFRDNTINIVDKTRDVYFGQEDATGKVIFNRGIEIWSNITHTPTFTVNREGVSTFVAANLSPTTSAVNIIASNSTLTQLPASDGVLLHITGQEDHSARIMIDAASINPNDAAALTGRRSRGTNLVPLALQADDAIVSIHANGYSPTFGYGNLINRATIRILASEEYTPTARGTYMEFNNIPNGSNVQICSMEIRDTGINFEHNSLSGITFYDASRQTTAWTGTTSATNIIGLANVATSGSYVDLTNKPSIVNYISVGAGLTQTGTSGNVGINSTGVANIAGTANQITITDSGSKNYTLSLPQAIATTSSPQFASMTITGNLNVTGNIISAGTSTIAALNLNLANATSTLSGINTGGILLGQAGANQRSILFNSTLDSWDTGVSGFITQGIVAAANVTALSMNVTGNAHFGTTNITPGGGDDFPNAEIQSDSNINADSGIVQRNHSNGTDASTNIKSVNDIGNVINGTNFITTGINSSTYSDPNFSIATANDGYTYVDGGHLLLGTASATKEIVIHTGGLWSNKERIRISDTGLSTGFAISSTATTGTAPLVIASTTRVANLNVATAGTADILTTARNINGTSFNGSTNITITANAQSLTSTTLNPTVAYSSLTTVGVLTSLAVTGNITSGNVSGTTGAFTNVSGTIITVNQPNITNVGTLANLTVTNPIQGTVLNGIVSTGNYTNPTWIVEVAGSKINGNVATAVSAYSAVNGVVTTGTYSDPSWITGLAGSKISGNVANATTAQNAVQANIANIATIVTNGVYTTDTATVTNTMLAGNINNAKLINSTITVNTANGITGGTTVSLGSFLNLENSDRGTSQNIFKNIAVAGQTTVSATTNTDTVNLVAGSGMTITTSGKNITLVAAGLQSITGTASQITASTVSGNVTLSLPTSVTMPGNLILAAGTAITAPLKFTSGNLLTTPSPGVMEYDGKVLYATPIDGERGVIHAEQTYVLNADRAGLNQTAIQSLFGVGVSLSSNTRYAYEIITVISKTTNNMELQYALAGNATLSQHAYRVVSSPSSPSTTLSAAFTMATNITSGFSTLIGITSPDTAASDFDTRITGIIDVTTAGTIIPSIGFTSTPGVLTIGSLSHMRIWPLGPADVNTSVGTWA